jgi:hypothetical protein
MFSDMQSPQTLSPPPSLATVTPPPKLYTPPNPLTFTAFLFDLLGLVLHALLAPFSAKLVPVHPSHPYGIDLYPSPPSVSTAVVPARRERRSRSKSPSASPSSMTLTEGTLDGEGASRRSRDLRSGFEVSRVRIRPGNQKSGVTSIHEGWAKGAFGI